MNTVPNPMIDPSTGSESEPILMVALALVFLTGLFAGYVFRKFLDVEVKK